MFRRSITKAELINGCQNEFGIYQSGEGGYKDLTDGCSKADQAGLVLARTVPGTSLLINAALETLGQPSVGIKLPAEINDRQFEAIRCIGRIEKLMRKRSVLPSFEMAYKASYAEPDAKERTFKQELYNYWRNARAPFMDVNIVAGGAARVLKKATINAEPHADILSRSVGLLIFAKIDQDNMRQARKFLGLPYAREEHYVIDDGDLGLTVTFSDCAREQLVNLQSEGSGCPSRRIISPSDPQQSLLRTEWAKIVHYMIPSHATASDDQLSYIR